MSILTNNSIRSLLNITDKNISFNENSYLMKKVKYVDTHVFNATLTYIPKACPKCGCLKNGHNIIKNGFKSSSIRLARISNIPAVLNLRKQRYICKDCENRFEALRSMAKADAPIACEKCKGDNTNRAVSVAFAHSAGRVIAGGRGGGGCGSCAGGSCGTCSH